MILPFMIHRRLGLATAVLVLTVLAVWPAQGQPTAPDPLLRRWVGTHLGRPLFLDFYGDSLLVVNDYWVLGFWYGPDSLIAYGDTSFAVRYRFSYDKLLIENAEGNTVTMSPQPTLARPVFGGRGTWATWIARADSGQLELQITRIGKRARWRRVPGGRWVEGTWRQLGRTFTFEWDSTGALTPPVEGLPADSTHQWSGLYDARAHQFIFEHTEPGTRVAIFRHRLRRR